MQRNTSSRDVDIAASCSIPLLEVDSKLEIDLWHKRFGHVFSSVLKKMLSSDLSSMTETLNKYTICPCAKQIRIHFTVSISKSSACFNLVYMDLWVSYKNLSHDGHKYFLTVVDDMSRYTWIFLLKLKSDVCTIIKQFLIS